MHLIDSRNIRCNHDSVNTKRYTALIKVESNHLNTIFGYQLQCCRPQGVWSTMKRPAGQRSVQPTINNIDQLNWKFIFRPDTTAPLSIQQYDDRPTLSIPPEEMAVHLKKIQLRCSAGPDGLLPSILQMCPNELAPVVSEIVNRSFSECRLPDSCRSVAITPLPKNASNSIQTKFRPITNTLVCSNFQKGYYFSKSNQLSINQPTPHTFLAKHLVALSMLLLVCLTRFYHLSTKSAARFGDVFLITHRHSTQSPDRDYSTNSSMEIYLNVLWSGFAITFHPEINMSCTKASDSHLSQTIVVFCRVQFCPPYFSIFS